MRTTLEERFSGIPAARFPERSTAAQGRSRLNISVVFTSESGTAAALKTAATLANRLGARITLVVPEVVSYQLPLNRPQVSREWNERRLSVLAGQASVETEVRFLLCRDREETLANELKPHSLVVIGGKRRLWPTSEFLMARRLRRLGHEVIFTETE